MSASAPARALLEAESTSLVHAPTTLRTSSAATRLLAMGLVKGLAIGRMFVDQLVRRLLRISVLGRRRFSAVSSVKSI